MAITHRTQSVKSQSSDPTLISKNEWNEGHTIQADEEGQHLVYTTVEAPTNVGFVDGAKFYSAFTSPSGAASPVTGATITVVNTTLIKTIFTITVTNGSTSGAGDLTVALQKSGVDNAIFTLASSTTRDVTFTVLREENAPASTEWRLNITAGTAISGTFTLSAITMGCV